MFKVLKDKLYGSSRPTSTELDGLLDASIELVVSLTERPLDADIQNSLRAMEVDYLHVPVADFTAPSIEQMNNIYDAYNSVSRHGGAVLVHCGAGIGRTGTVLACLLAAEEKLSADAAVRRIRDLRPGALETPQQERFVADWLKSHEKKK